MRIIILLACIVTLLSCDDQELFDTQTRHDLWLLHKGAQLPIVIEGNTSSKVFVILLHGGPGGSAQDFNAGSKSFSDRLEEKYAMVYYDQRNSGLSKGEWDESKLTIEQHIEDLDKVIDFLNHKFSSDIQLFLAGHSWGGYLGTCYLLEPNRKSKLSAFINIDGQTHRNFRNKHNLETISEIANEQIGNNQSVDDWSALLEEVLTEIAKNTTNYNEDSESIVNGLLSRASQLISQDKLVVTNSIFTDNYDPLHILINERKGSLIEQMYAYDVNIESNLSKIDLPVLNVYGKYDVITSPFQGEYLLNNISTQEEDKKLVILEQSGHSSMKNEPIFLAKEIEQWIENYR